MAVRDRIEGDLGPMDLAAAIEKLTDGSSRKAGPAGRQIGGPAGRSRKRERVLTGIRETIVSARSLDILDLVNTADNAILQERMYFPLAVVHFDYDGSLGPRR